MYSNETIGKAQAARQYDTAGAPEAPPELGGELARLDNSIASVEATVEALSARLGPVLRPIPTATLKADKEAGGLSPLGGAVRGASERLQSAQHRLGCLLEALAL